MRNYLVRICVACCLVMLSMWGFIAGPRASGEESYGECEARCGALTGEAKYRCLRTCISTKKRQSPRRESGSHNSYRECVERCGEGRGLEKIRCIRICMDEKREAATIVKDAAQETARSHCERRCAMLSGPMKEKCLARCGKNGVQEYRDPLRFKK